MKRILAAAVAALALGGTFTASAAQAQLAPDLDGYVTNGPVEALVRADDGSTFIGGVFTRVGPRVGHGFAVTTGDATPGSGFADVSGGDVLASVSDGAGGWYIGGTFTTVGGTDQASLAHLDASGDLDTDFDPVVSRADGSAGEVRALVLDDNGSLYLGGDFQRVNSPGADNRANVAEVDAADGSLRTTVTSPVKGTVNALAILRPGGSLPKMLVLGGRFSQLGVGVRGNAGAIKLSGVGAGSPDGWNPDISAGGSVGAATVHGLVTAGDPAGTQVVYLVGSFEEAGSTFDSRTNAVAFPFSASGGPSSSPTAWAPTLDGSARVVATDDPSGAGDIYVGGDFTEVNGSPFPSIARLSASTGAPVTGFDPPDIELFGGPAVVRSITVARGLTTASNRVVVGGEFDTVDGADRYGVAAIDNDGDVLAWDPNPSDWTRSVAVDGLSQAAAHGIYVGGEFTAAGPQTANRRSVAKLDAAGVLDPAWDPGVTVGSDPGEVRSLVLAGGDLYVGGAFDAVGGESRDNLAKVAASGAGSVDLAWAPALDAPVNALAATSTDLFVAGDFGNVDGTTRNGAAKVSLSDGTVDPNWDPDLDDGLPTCVCTVAVSDGNVYLGGEFDSAGTTTRNGVMRTPVTGDGAPDGWDVDLGVGGRATAIDVFGMDVYVGGSFSSVNGGAVTRNNLLRARTDAGGAVDPTWDPNPDDSVDAISVLGDDVYLAGAFTHIDAPFVPGLGRVSATGTGAVDPSWDPSPQWEIDLVAPIVATWDAVDVGGGFESMSGLSASGYAQFSTGRSATPVATIDLATTHDFGSVDVGQHSTAFAYTIVNSGNVDLTIDLISATSPAFEVEDGDCPSTLAPGATCAVSIEFVPQATGMVNASLVVDTDGGDPSVGLTGTGDGALASLTPAGAHDFGALALGQTSQAFDYVLNSDGTQALDVTAIEITGVDADQFEVTAGCLGQSIQPGQTCTIGVVFAPSATGAKSASLEIDTSAGTITRALNGEGTAAAPPVPVPEEPKVEQPKGGAPTGEAPKTENPKAAMRAPKISVPTRCARPSRAGVVRLPIVVRSERPLAVAVSVDYAAGTKGLDRCPKRNADRRFKGDVRNVDTLKRVPVRAGAAAVMVDHRRTIELTLKPGLYRVTVRAHVAPSRLSKPTRRWVRVLNP